jgi:polysaccharide pyruvyl transferase WcaK-like protein
MTRPLTIEIHGTGAQNRGAQLMAIAIAEHVRVKHPGSRIVVPPEYGSLPMIHAQGFSLVNDFSGHWLNRNYMRLMPPNLRRRFDFVDPADVDIVLDASGFSFSDQWGAESAIQLADKMGQRKRKLQPLVLLPQAFGPFASHQVATATRRVLKRASLICVRDNESLRHVRELGKDFDLNKFPDFTLSVPAQPGDLELPIQRFAAIVPNMRMLDRTTYSNIYIEFLAALPNLLSARGISPLVVLHDSDEDASVLDRVGAAMDGVPCVSHPDPRVLKWVLKEASFVIGSRFHALVGALSQAVPCIGTGWSHKYSELFDDFGCSDALVRDLHDTEAVRLLLDEFADSTRRHARQTAIGVRATILKESSNRMWELVDDIIDAVPGRQRATH